MPCTQPLPTMSRRLARRGIGRATRTAGALAMILAASGCYTYTPITSAPAPGTTVAFTLTDQGRVSLGPRIGEAARSFEADVLSASDTGYVVAMRQVTYLNGQTHKWTNERLTVARQDVTNTRERRFSRSRTIAVTAAAVGSTVAFIITRSLIGGGGGEQERPGGGGTPTEQ